MKGHKYTFIGLILSAIVYLVVTIFHMDLFEKIIYILSELEDYEIDEFLIPLAIFAVFAVVDLKRKQRALTIEEEKIKVYKAMIFAVHHVLNNFLQQMQYFRMKAEVTPEFDHATLSLYDQVIDETSLQIEALSSIAKIDEQSIKRSIAPKPRGQPSTAL